VLAASALACCGPAEPRNTADATNASAGAATAQEPPAAPLPWRYLPALAAGVPAGLAAEPVLELADGLRGHARFVVAVASGDAPVRVEVWDFSQLNEREKLERVGEPQLLLDLREPDAALAADAVAALRREIASPATETVRPLGLPGEPAAVLAELARLAAASAGPGDAATRARALAQFTRGLDDRLLWDRLPELLRRLRGAPWTVGTQSPVGARRVRISATEGARPLTLELTRTQDRWTLSDVVDGP